MSNSLYMPTQYTIMMEIIEMTCVGLPWLEGLFKCVIRFSQIVRYSHAFVVYLE